MKLSRFGLVAGAATIFISSFLVGIRVHSRISGDLGVALSDGFLQQYVDILGERHRHSERRRDLMETLTKAHLVAARHFVIQAQLSEGANQRR